MAVNRIGQFEERVARTERLLKLPVRRLRDRENPIEHYDDLNFKRRFHMNKTSALYIVNLIKKDLCAPVKRGCQLPPMLQFLSVCRFYASGSFQLVIGDLHVLAQPTMSRLVRRISIAIAKHRSRFVKFPTDAREVANIKTRFHEIAHFPDVVGAIDCTHVQIDSPGGENAELFRNRKRHFSINVQAICTADLKFTNIVARWYGSAHDSRIFENSLIYDKLESRAVRGILLGDSGYPCLPFILTPFTGKSLSVPQLRYNKSHCKTRNPIERGFGVLKRRFPCLRYLRLKLSTSLIVIPALAVLHNIVRGLNDIYEDDDYQDDDKVPDLDSNGCVSSSGRALRESVVRNHFQ